jgi:transposase
MNGRESGKVWSNLCKEKPAMPAKKYLVALTNEERATLEQMLRRGTHSARKLTRARVWLKADAGWRDHDIAHAVDTSRLTVERIRQRFTQCRLGALEERPRPGKKPLLDAKGEARLIAEACTVAPEGRERWTLQLLADRVIELQLAVSCSKDTVWRVLKKTRSNRGSSSTGASPT